MQSQNPEVSRTRYLIGTTDFCGHVLIEAKCVVLKDYLEDVLTKGCTPHTLKCVGAVVENGLGMLSRRS
jgi:hypothetical protein